MNPIVKVVQRFTGLPQDVLTDDADLREDLGADSITLLEIISTIESEYGDYEVPPEELEAVKTIGDIKKIVAKYTGEQE